MPKNIYTNSGPSAHETAAVIDELNHAFQAFKAENDARLAAVEKNKSDVIQAEKVDRINAAVTEMQARIEEIGRLSAARTTLQQHKPADDAYSAKFRDFARGAITDIEMATVKSPRASMSTSSAADGGILVPEQMEQTVDRIMSDMSVMRSIASVQTISTGYYSLPVTSGKAAAGWVSEQASRPQTQNPQLSEIKITPREMYANPAATQQLLDDAFVDVESWLAGEIVEVFSEFEGAGFINGQGGEQPNGILSYTTVADASYSWGRIGRIATGVAAALSDANNNGIDALIELQGALRTGYRANATFVMNRKTAAEVRKLKDDQGQYHWQPATALGAPATLLGTPALTDDNMPDIGAGTFPIAIGDFARAYQIVDRIGIRVLRDPYTAKPFVLFYTTRRVGGGVKNFEALKLLRVSTAA